MKMKKQLLSILLSLVLVLGLVPGMSLTAYAATSHGITINSAQHGSVSASVDGSAATSAEEGATVTLTTSPENGYRLKSISGTYADYPNETIKYGATGSKHFNLTSFKTQKNQWCLFGCTDGKSLTITSKDNKMIDRLEITISEKGYFFKPSDLYTQNGEGTLSVTGNTIFVTSINKTGLSIYSKASGYNYGCYANSVKIYYKDGTSTSTLNISATGDKNVYKFTMPVVIQGNVSITAEFEEAHNYRVTITPGSNMTKTTDSGAESQTDLSGAMEDVVYTANDGYYFPTDYSVTAVNGISVTRKSYTQIKVSGTPTADAAISLTAPTAKTDQATPTDLTATKASSSTAADGKISGVTDTMEYQKDGASTWTAVGENKTEITGLTAGTYKVRYAGTADKNASDATSVEVGVKEDQTAPTELTATKASGSTATDGKISGVTSAMEYQIDGATTWTAVGENQTEITGLTAGTYKVRYAGTADKNASPVSTVEVGVKVAPTVTAPTAKTLTYNGQAQELVIAGSTEDGTLYYAVTTENTAPADNLYTTSIPSKTDAGTYFVYYRVIGDGNHEDTEPEGPITVTIEKAADPDNPKPGPDPDKPEPDPEYQTPFSSGASLEKAEALILQNAYDEDPEGTSFTILKARSPKQTASKITVQWSKAPGAASYVIYGNKCGKTNKMTKLTVTKKTKLNFKKVAGNKVKKGTFYKFMIVAVDASGNVISTSKIIHVATKGGKFGNPTKVTVKKPKKAKAVLAVGKTVKIKASEGKPKDLKLKHHVKLRYESSNEEVATVSKTGVIKAEKAGSAQIYVFAQNGQFKVVKVTVK